MLKTHITCSRCKKKRLIKFYDTPKARICITCKNRQKRLKRQNSKSYILKFKDTEWSLLIRTLAGKCEYCGATEHLHAHHIFGRQNRKVRHDPDNGVCLCANHHKFSTEFSAHETPTEFTIWIIKKRGINWYEKLQGKALGEKTK